MIEHSLRDDAKAPDHSSEFSRLCASRAGRIKALTALMIVPLFACVGYAIDYTHVVSVRTKLQAAADAAALSARTTRGGTQATAKAVTESFAKPIPVKKGDGRHDRWRQEPQSVN
jgi:Flp pilus assembly protein TadG